MPIAAAEIRRSAGGSLPTRGRAAERRARSRGPGLPARTARPRPRRRPSCRPVARSQTSIPARTKRRREHGGAAADVGDGRFVGRLHGEERAGERARGGALEAPARQREEQPGCDPVQGEVGGEEGARGEPPGGVIEEKGDPRQRPHAAGQALDERRAVARRRIVDDVAVVVEAEAAAEDRRPRRERDSHDQRAAGDTRAEPSSGLRWRRLSRPRRPLQPPSVAQRAGSPGGSTACPPSRARSTVKKPWKSYRYPSARSSRSSSGSISTSRALSRRVRRARSSFTRSSSARRRSGSASKRFTRSPGSAARS